MEVKKTRRRHDEALLARCVARVLAGERAASVAHEAQIPYSTLMTRVTWRKRGQEPVTSATRKKKPSKTTLRLDDGSGEAAALAPGEPPSELPSRAETDLLAWMARLQRARICVRRRDVLDKANAVMVALGGAPALGAVWFSRFRLRHPEVSGHGSSLVVAEEALAWIDAAREAVEAEAAAPWAAILDPRHLEEAVETSDDTPATNSDAGGGGANAELAGLQVGEDEDALGMTPSERAVALLQEQYSASLAPEDLAEAFDVALDPVRAKLLLTLRPGELRDLWVSRQVEKRRRPGRGGR